MASDNVLSPLVGERQREGDVVCLNFNGNTCFDGKSRALLNYFRELPPHSFLGREPYLDSLLNISQHSSESLVVSKAPLEVGAICSV